MRIVILVFMLLIFALSSCTNTTKPHYCVDALVNIGSEADSIMYADVRNVDDAVLSRFSVITDTLNATGDEHSQAEYFLYDITGDRNPELWVKTGTCEADYLLMAYCLDDCEEPFKIYEGDGGHSDYFVYNNQLVCVMCNTGAGVVITYEYDGKRVIDSMVEFSTWNDEGNALFEAHDCIADKKLRYWQENYGDFIKLKPL